LLGRRAIPFLRALTAQTQRRDWVSPTIPADHVLQPHLSILLDDRDKNNNTTTGRFCPDCNEQPMRIIRRARSARPNGGAKVSASRYASTGCSCEETSSPRSHSSALPASIHSYSMNNCTKLSLQRKSNRYSSMHILADSKPKRSLDQRGGSLFLKLLQVYYGVFPTKHRCLMWEQQHRPRMREDPRSQRRQGSLG
jgi:hypothetical protein